MIFCRPVAQRGHPRQRRGEDLLTGEGEHAAQRYDEDPACALGNQRGARRSIEDTLELAWKLLLSLPEADLKRIDPELLARYGHREERDT